MTWNILHYQNSYTRMQKNPSFFIPSSSPLQVSYRKNKGKSEKKKKKIKEKKEIKWSAWQIRRGEWGGDNQLFNVSLSSSYLKREHKSKNVQSSIFSHARAASDRSAKLINAKPLARCVSRSRARNTLVTRPKRSNRSRNSCSSANSLTCLGSQCQ